MFKEVTLTDSNRFGLLEKAAVPMRTSYSDRTFLLRGVGVDKIDGERLDASSAKTSTPISKGKAAGS